MVGGRYEERDFGSTGSGSRLAKSYLRSAFRPGLDQAGAVEVAVSALVAAAEEDTATGGPDLQRGILPTVVAVDADGVRDADEAQLRAAAERALETIR